MSSCEKEERSDFLPFKFRMLGVFEVPEQARPEQLCKTKKQKRECHKLNTGYPSARLEKSSQH